MIFLGNVISNGYGMSVVLAFMLAYVFALLIGFGIHEFSHAFAAVKLGDPTPRALGRLTLNPFKHFDGLGLASFLLIGFGWAKPVPVNPLNFKKYRKGMFWVSVSGVLANLILAFLFSGAWFLFTTHCSTGFDGTMVTFSNALMYFLYFFFEYSVILNITMFIFNLIPVYPLDGFNLLRSFCRSNNKYINFMYKYGTFILLIILISPIFDVVYNLLTSNILGLFFKFWGLFV